MDDFVIARKPDPDSALPYLLRLPLPRPVVHHPRSRRRPGARPRAGEPQPAGVHRLRGGREAIFWQSPRTTRKARPGVRTPTARASGQTELGITVDSGERYPYRFASQQATTTRSRLRCGDYGVHQDGRLVGVVERKSLEDLAASLVDGRLAGQLSELATVPRAAVVVEERYSKLFSLPFVQPGFVADLLARVQVRWPSVPVFFAETRPMAEEWTFRFLGACLAEQSGADQVATAGRPVRGRRLAARGGHAGAGACLGARPGLRVVEQGAGARPGRRRLRGRAPLTLARRRSLRTGRRQTNALAPVIFLPTMSSWMSAVPS